MRVIKEVSFLRNCCAGSVGSGNEYLVLSRLLLPTYQPLWYEVFSLKRRIITLLIGEMLHVDLRRNRDYPYPLLLFVEFYK